MIEDVLLVSSDKYGAPVRLSISLTSKCNLNCSFCGGAEYMKREDDYAALCESVTEVLRTTPTITSVRWIGGEPLLRVRRMEELFNKIKQSYPKIVHELTTNGTLINFKNLPLLRSMDTISLSLDGYEKSERPLLRMAKRGNWEFFRVLRELTNVRTWNVVTRDQLADPRWFEDIVKLHKALSPLKLKSFSMLLDGEMEKPLSPDHVLNLVYGYRKIVDNCDTISKQTDRPTSYKISKLFNESCNYCSANIWVYSDGHIQQDANQDIVVERGCQKLAKAIGLPAYNYLRATIGTTREVKHD